MLATRAVNTAFREGSCYFLAYLYLRNKMEYAHTEFMKKMHKYETIREKRVWNKRKLELNLNKGKNTRRGSDV